MSDDVGSAEAGQWMTYTEAATFYAVDPRTVQRWVTSGKLRRHPDTRPPMVWVTLPDTGPTRSGDIGQTMSGDVGEQSDMAITPAERLSDIIRQNTAPLLEALERSQERERQSARENGILSERNAALERVVEVVRQVSDDERQRADDLAAQLAEQATALEEARGEVERMKGRSWWDRLRNR